MRQDPAAARRFAAVAASDRRRHSPLAASSSPGPAARTVCQAEPPKPAESSAPPTNKPPAAEEAPPSGSGSVRDTLRAAEAASGGDKRRMKAESTDMIATTLTRRFGLAGGLAWVGFLAFGVIGEQVRDTAARLLTHDGLPLPASASPVLASSLPRAPFLPIRLGSTLIHRAAPSTLGSQPRRRHPSPTAPHTPLLPCLSGQDAAGAGQRGGQHQGGGRRPGGGHTGGPALHRPQDRRRVAASARWAPGSRQRRGAVGKGLALFLSFVLKSKGGVAGGKCPLLPAPLLPSAACFCCPPRRTPLPTHTRLHRGAGLQGLRRRPAL